MRVQLCENSSYKTGQSKGSDIFTDSEEVRKGCAKYYTQTHAVEFKSEGHMLLWIGESSDLMEAKMSLLLV